MTQALLPLPNGPTPQRRRGRPPGSGNKRSADLARYVEAMFAGATPGQQAAQLALVTPKEMREARAAAQALRISDAELLQPLMLAMVVKAAHLARALGCERRDAWLLLQKEREALMPYIHPKQAPKEPVKAGAQVATVYMIPDGEDVGALADFSGQDEDTLEMVEENPDPSA